MSEKLLSEQLEAEISGRVRCGPWHSADEFVRHSIKAADALSDLQAAIAEGDGQIARGESTDGEEFFNLLEAELKQTPGRDPEG